MLWSVVVLVLATGLGVLPAPPASALSCVEPRTVVTEAEVVYAGRVVDTRGSRILVEVSEVWRGGPVDAQVWLELDLESWFAWVDRSGHVPDGFTTTEDWVFAPEGGGVSPCSAWPATQTRRLRPAEVGTPVAVATTPEPATEPSTQTTSGRPAWLLPSGLVLLGLLATGGYTALRRRQT